MDILIMAWELRQYGSQSSSYFLGINFDRIVLLLSQKFVPIIQLVQLDQTKIDWTSSFGCNYQVVVVVSVLRMMEVMMVSKRDCLVYFPRPDSKSSQGNPTL